MDENIKEIGGLSRKAKINIFIVVFLIFILISIFSSIRQITNIIQNREKIIELEEKLKYERQNNIKLLAEEKTLYNEEAIEIEARKQFNMTKGAETNYFVEIIQGDAQNETDSVNLGAEENTGIFAVSGSSGGVYSDSNLWENIKILYESEIRQ